MPSEIELKLDLSAACAERILGSGLLGQPDKTVEQVSLYFDSPDRLLFSAGYTLRIRRAGGRLVQTVKAATDGPSLLSRSEWEMPVETERPVLDGSNPLAREFGAGLSLAPVFEVHVERRVWTVATGDAVIEVAYDEGDVVAGERRMALRELELELKEGEPSALFSLARQMLALAPLRLGVRSKAERGFMLLDAQKLVHKAETLQLSPAMTALDAFQAIAASCLRHFRLNEDILLRGRNDEALHQARVGLRRLRSAFTIFKPMLPGDEPLRLKEGLRWLAGVLGEARDIDVLLEASGDAGERATLADAREAAYDAALSALGSERARELIFGLGEWLHCGSALMNPATGSLRALPAPQFACRALDRLRKKLKKRGRALEKIGDGARHEVRKDAKKLRYGAEFFRSLFPEKQAIRRSERFAVAMEVLQDHLGALNDLAAGGGILKELGLPQRKRHDASDTDAKAAMLAAAQTALDDVIDARRFWR